MSQEVLDAVNGVVFTFAIGYGLGLAFVVIILIIRQRNN